jgi:hypothetical protein
MGLTLFLQLMTMAISVQHFLLFNQVGIISKCIVSSVCLVVIKFVGVVLYYHIITSMRYETTTTKNSTIYYCYTTLI